MTIEEIKNKITLLLSDACEAHHYDMIYKLSVAYNNLCQAQKARTIPVTEFTKDGTIRSYKERELQLALYVGNNFEQYTNTKAESLYTVQKNVGAKGQQKKKNALYAVKGLRHSKAGIKNIARLNAEI